MKGMISGGGRGRGRGVVGVATVEEDVIRVYSVNNDRYLIGSTMISFCMWLGALYVCA